MRIVGLRGYAVQTPLMLPDEAFDGGSISEGPPPNTEKPQYLSNCKSEYEKAP
jgi:hypothetical protein